MRCLYFLIVLIATVLPSFGFHQTYLKASNTWGFDRFGSAVAVDGDTLVVGSFREDSGSAGVNASQDNDDGKNSGAVYVFVRDGDSWVQEAFLKASNPDEGDQFGISVAISGDTIVVGSERESSSATGVDGDQVNNDLYRSGAAYVFTRDEGVWNQQAYLKASNPGSGYIFGYDVDISGDLIVVGSRGESSPSADLPHEDGSLDSGAAYLFRRSGGSWLQEAFLKPDNVKAGDHFGISVSVSGESVLVGAYLDDGLEGEEVYDSGAAYVFGMLEGQWRQEAYLRASNPGSGDHFGQGVSIDSDRLLIGSPLEDGSGSGVNPLGNDESEDAGAAYLFERTGSTWAETNYLKASYPGQGMAPERVDDRFGTSVAIEEGLIVIGAYKEDGPAIGEDGVYPDGIASEAGAAYLYIFKDFEWSFFRYLKASNAEEDDAFGRQVALSGGTIVIAARDEDSSARGVNGSQGNETGEEESGERSGAVYAFDPDTSSFPSVIGAVMVSGSLAEFTFEGFPGLTDWQIYGDESLPVVTNLTSLGVLEEVAPGQYRFSIDLGNPEPRFFFQLGN